MCNMKLSDFAKLKGVSYRTAHRWFKAGLLKAQQLPTGTIIVEEKIPVNGSTKKVSIYARVSSYDKKEDLNRQVDRCIAFAETKGLEIDKIVKEIASGMNDRRPKLVKLLNDNPEAILVEHKDRLTRFGFNYFEILLPKLNCDLLVINRDVEEQADLIKDLIAIITSFCCKIYGLRRGTNKARILKKEINSND